MAKFRYWIGWRLFRRRRLSRTSIPISTVRTDDERKKEEYHNAEKRREGTGREPTTDAVEIIDRKFFKGQPEMLALLEEARAEDEVAQKIYKLRRDAGLSQRELARLVGTTATI